jgi:hypothetical protein
MIELESMAVEMPVVVGHPNRVGFRGVLTLVDMPSQRAPSGASRHRVVLTRKAAEAAIPSLLGMALDYSPGFDGHDVRRKVGIITSADVVGRNLEVGGYLYAKDFPDIVEEVARFGRRPVEVAACRDSMDMHAVSAAANAGEGARLRASLRFAVRRLRELTAGMRKVELPPPVGGIEAGDGAGLGMSFEITRVIVADRRARIWTLNHVLFTGAAILRKDRAAFADTWIELSPES